MPLYVYDNWSAYDEISDSTPLTEHLAMRQFSEMLRLRDCGVRFEAYLMDAFWYAKDGGYLEWKPDRWPNGPDAWLDACKQQGVLPGLWFPANAAYQFDPPDAWKDSLAADGYGLCCFEGGFMAGFIEVLEHWYSRGVRVFKFDFAAFGAVPAGREREYSPEVAQQRNRQAFRTSLARFKSARPDLVLLAYNGFEEAEFMPWTDRPPRHVFDRTWMEVFDTFYCGDPRPADLPLPDFFRTCDVYADAMINLLHRDGLALEEIDNCAFMIGTCGTCYKRGSEGWKTTAILSLARGGRVHVTMGNMEALTDAEGTWLGRVERAYEREGTPQWYGGNPGSAELYGYRTKGLWTLVNPSLDARRTAVGTGWRPLYWDGDMELLGGELMLGAGAVAVLVEAASTLEPWGGESGIARIRRLEANWTVQGRAAKTRIVLPRTSDALWSSNAISALHVVFRQVGADGLAVRPYGKSGPSTMRIEVSRNGAPLPVSRPDDRVVWSGCSWGYGIVPGSSILPGDPIDVVVVATEPEAEIVIPAVYAAGSRD